MIVDWGKATPPLYYANRHFALVTPEPKVVGPTTICKDYLTDMLAGAYNQKKVGGRGYFSIYDPEIHASIPFDRPRVIFGDQGVPDRVPNIVDLIHQVESELGLAPTIHELVDNSPATTKFVYLEGDPVWLTAPPMFGLWTVLIREGKRHELGVHYRLEEYGELEHLRTLIDFVSTRGAADVFGTDLAKNWSILSSYGDQHDEVGPHAYCEGRTTRHFPHWKRP